LDHYHPPKFNHAENQQKKYGRNDSELNGRRASSVSSAWTANFLQFNRSFGVDLRTAGLALT